jgi:hypothetical protein
MTAYVQLRPRPMTWYMQVLEMQVKLTYTYPARHPVFDIATDPGFVRLCGSAACRAWLTVWLTIGADGHGP